MKAENYARSGFTLLEILVAVSIFGIVTAMVFSSFHTVFSGANEISFQSDLMEMGNTCINRLKTDLESLHISLDPRYKQPDIDDDPEIYRFVGTNETMGGNTFAKLRFTALSHLKQYNEDRAGIVEITYYGEQNEDDDGFALKRKDKHYPYPDDFEEDYLDPIICEKVRYFKIIYYDHEDAQFDLWDSESRDNSYSTPKSVVIELSLGTEEQHFEFKTEIILRMFRYEESDT
ncbi:MAG: type II secretion system protein [Desulfobacteraceae bacterium]|nr:type II secretion system protein [Desulfobacteraceae bacterium]